MVGTETVAAELRTRVQANGIEVFRQLARVTDGGVIEEGDGMVLIFTGLPFAPFNTAFFTRVPEDGAAAVARARAFFEPRGVPWSLRVSGAAAEALATAARAAGLMPGEMLPGMLLTPMVGEPPDPPGFTVRVVKDAAALRLFYETGARGFEGTSEVLEMFYPPALLTAPDVTLYVGLVDGEPAATAARFTSHRIGKLYTISTVPAYRRRGFGEAITWRAALDGREEGCVASFLQASAMGFPLYARMGYQHIEDERAYTGG